MKNRVINIGDFIEISGKNTFRVVGEFDGDLFLRGVFKREEKNVLSANIQPVKLDGNPLPYWIKKVPPIEIDDTVSKSFDQIYFV